MSDENEPDDQPADAPSDLYDSMPLWEFAKMIGITFEEKEQ